MNLTKIFRIIITASILISIAAIISDFIEESFLPKPLQDYLETKASAELTLPEILAIVASIPLIILLIASYVGLYLWKPWGRTLFLCSGIVSYAVIPFWGPYVYSGVSLTLYDLSSVLSGVIIALAYFSPAAEKFRKNLDSERADCSNPKSC